MYHQKIDYQIGNLGLRQPKAGYRFGIDSFILAAHVADAGALTPILDIGCGMGVVALLLGRCGPGTITGVEIQQDLYEYAVLNAKENCLGHKFTFINKDFNNYKDFLLPNSFQTIVSNPPFYPVSSGMINPGESRAIARHEVSLTLGTVMDGIRFLLKPKGSAFLVYPGIGLNRFTKTAYKTGLSMAGIRMIFPNAADLATMFVAELTPRPNPETRINTPWRIPTEGRRVPKEVVEILEACVLQR